jgi:hypothetical protein
VRVTLKAWLDGQIDLDPKKLGGRMLHHLIAGATLLNDVGA